MKSGAENSDVFKTIIDAHPNPCVVHIDFKPLYANHAFAKFSGLSSVHDVLKLESLFLLFNKEHWPEAKKRYQQVLGGQEYSEPYDIDHCDVQGNPQVAEITDTLITWQGSPAMCTYISVVTDRVKREALYQEMAMQDELTGAKNRRYLVQKFSRDSQSLREDCDYLALIDLDHFKQVNDTWGHSMGDNLLKAVADALSELFDTNDTLTRIGGEEFAMVIEANSIQALGKKMACIQAAIKSCYVANNKSIRCSASIGVARYRNNDSFESIFKRADTALYRAKSLGRDRVSYYSDMAVAES